MQKNKAFLGGYLVSFSVSVFFWALLIGVLGILFIYVFLGNPCTISELSLIGLVVISSSAVLSGGLSGVGLAKIVKPIILYPLDVLIAKNKNKLSNLQSAYEWPGRQVLDELRGSQHSSLRRRFLAAGLDTSIPMPKKFDQEQVGKLFTLFQSVETVLLAQGAMELAQNVRIAKNLSFNYFRLARFQEIFSQILFLFLPSLVIIWIVTNLSPIILYFSEDCTKEHGFLEQVSLIKNFVQPGVFVVLSPFVVYVVGTLLFLMTWGLAQKTKSRVDDILFLGLSWLVAGAVGVTVLISSFSQEQPISKPDSFVQLTATLKWLTAPLPFPACAPEFSIDCVQENYRDYFSQETITDIELQKKLLTKHSKELGYLKGINKIPLIVVKIFVVAWLTVILILLLRVSCNKIFRKLASRTLQKNDDMAIEIVRIFGTFILAAVGFGWIVLVVLSHFHGSEAVNTGVGALMPYAILVAVAGSILGVGSRDLLDNFFAGISLQIDGPFEIGERIVLADGEVCEVRSIGMRSTHFFNISDNADMFVPNTELAKQTVTNLSRPDRQYRRSIRFYVSSIVRNETGAVDNKLDALELAEGAMLLAAYSIEGIDIPTVLDQQLEASSFYKSRNSIVSEYQRVQERFDEFMNAQFKFEGIFQPVGEVVERNAFAASNSIQKLNKTKSLRWDHVRALPKLRNISQNNSDGLKAECTLARQASHSLFKLALCFYTLGATYPTLKSELEPLSLEILRAPSVRSKHAVSEDGEALWEVELLVYAQLTEQSDEIVHHLNLLVNRYFIALGIAANKQGQGQKIQAPSNIENE